LPAGGVSYDHLVDFEGIVGKSQDWEGKQTEGNHSGAFFIPNLSMLVHLSACILCTVLGLDFLCFIIVPIGSIKKSDDC